MAECIFCKIIAKEIPAYLIHEDDATVAFLDVSPRAPGHAMIIPKHHSPNIVDLPNELVGPLFEAVKKVAERLAKALGPDGFTIGMNQGSISGQSVPHLHVHVMPRFEGDGGGSIHSVVNNPPKEALEEIRTKINNTQ
jgi:histidine triad (HIT) family protein